MLGEFGSSEMVGHEPCGLLPEICSVQVPYGSATRAEAVAVANDATVSVLPAGQPLSAACTATTVPDVPVSRRKSMSRLGRFTTSVVVSPGSESSAGARCAPGQNGVPLAFLPSGSASAQSPAQAS